MTQKAPSGLQIGQTVTIKKEWRDPGDDGVRVVRTLDEPGKPRLDVSDPRDAHLPLWPMELVQLDMLEGF